MVEAWWIVHLCAGGASAFDNAQFALSQGVGEVHVFVRREELPKINPIRFMEFVGEWRGVPRGRGRHRFRGTRSRTPRCPSGPILHCASAAGCAFVCAHPSSTI